MFTRTTWTTYDQSQLLTGGGLTGVGIEIDRRLDGLRAEAETRRLVDGRAADRRPAISLASLGVAIQRRETRQPVKSATRAG
jgi:hypothetical protein